MRRAIAIVGVLLATAAPLRATPLVVTEFPSLGPFPTAPGDYTFDTSGTPTLTAPGGLSLTGLVGPDDIAVFAFASIFIDTGMVVRGVGSRPLALLSYADVTITGTGV